MLSPCGKMRCMHCLRLGADCSNAPCLAVGARAHTVQVLAHGLFCSSCGAYSFNRTVKLHGPCLRKPASGVVAARLAKLNAGQHPISGAILGMPRAMASPAEDFAVLLGDPPDGLYSV